jgi:enoyl-CoA hydratase/carnithine racemase
MGIDYMKVKEDRLAIFTINRPQAHNALNMETIRELHCRMLKFRDDPEMLVGILTGAGERAFSTGADITDTLNFLKENRDVPGAFPATPMRGLEIWKPLIAAINGVALGGGLELALACDIIIASENARFGFPEATLGIIPGWGGTQRLARAIPFGKAIEMILTGTMIDAIEAYRIGLVNKIVSLEELMPTARKLAKTISHNAPLAIKAAKEAILKGSSLTLEDGLELEKSLEHHLWTTEDFDEGISAFREKRKPVFVGR